MSRSLPIREVRRKGIPASRVLAFLLLALGAVILLLPLVWMVSTSLKPEHQVFDYPPRIIPTTFDLANYLEVFTKAPFARQFLNSIYIGVLNIAGTLVVSSLAGYAFARLRFPGRNVLFILFLSALLLPVEVTIVPLYGLMSGLGWIGTHIPLIVEPMLGTPAVVGTFLIRQYFLALPRELEDAGRVDGLGWFGVFWRIAIPLARPALATLAVLTFLTSWNAFLEPLIFTAGNRELWTVPIALDQYKDFDSTPTYSIQMAATTISVLPVALVFSFAQRYIVAGISRSGLGG